VDGMKPDTAHTAPATPSAEPTPPEPDAPELVQDEAAAPEPAQDEAEPPEPFVYPDTPPDFEEGSGEDAEEDEPPDMLSFADMHIADKAEIAISFLERKRFALFAPGEDTGVLEFIISVLGYAREIEK